MPQSWARGWFQSPRNPEESSDLDLFLDVQSSRRWRCCRAWGRWWGRSRFSRSASSSPPWSAPGPGPREKLKKYFWSLCLLYIGYILPTISIVFFFRIFWHLWDCFLIEIIVKNICHLSGCFLIEIFWHLWGCPSEGAPGRTLPRCTPTSHCSGWWCFSIRHPSSSSSTCVVLLLSLRLVSALLSGGGGGNSSSPVIVLMMNDDGADNDHGVYDEYNSKFKICTKYLGTQAVLRDSGDRQWGCQYLSKGAHLQI